jgi:hypothetical protein
VERRATAHTSELTQACSSLEVLEAAYVCPASSEVQAGAQPADTGSDAKATEAGEDSTPTKELSRLPAAPPKGALKAGDKTDAKVSLSA